MKKYKLFCITDNRYEEVVSSVEPTQCPIDSLHSIRGDSVSLIEENIEYFDGTPTQLSLDEYKQLKKNEIDRRTRELIGQGITFNSVVFSSSETAQRNWMALDQFKSYNTYPVSVTTEDDGQYSFADATEITNFVLTAMSTINGHYASGRQLKLQVNAATNEAGVDAVVDNR